MKFRSTEPELLYEIEALMNNYPDRVEDYRWNLELAQLMLNARKYAKQAYAQHVLKSTKLAYRTRAALLIASHRN